MVSYERAVAIRKELISRGVNMNQITIGKSIASDKRGVKAVVRNKKQ